MIWDLENMLLAKICNKILGDNKNDIYFLSNVFFIFSGNIKLYFQSMNLFLKKIFI